MGPHEARRRRRAKPLTPGRTSTTHGRAVHERDNGELAEDVVQKRVLDREGSSGVDEGSPDDELDEESKESFPASDAPSSRAGAQDDDAQSSAVVDSSLGRVVERLAVQHPPERANPDDPVPKTLRREAD